MDDESATLLFGLLLVVVVVSWLLQIVSVLASFIALGWVCWKLIRRVVPRSYRWLCGKVESVQKWWWSKLWDDPLEKAQREATQEIQNTVHYYVDMQKRAAQWADAQGD